MIPNVVLLGSVLKNFSEELVVVPEGWVGHVDDISFRNVFVDCTTGTHEIPPMKYIPCHTLSSLRRALRASCVAVNTTALRAMEGSLFGRPEPFDSLLVVVVTSDDCVVEQTSDKNEFGRFSNSNIVILEDKEYERKI